MSKTNEMVRLVIWDLDDTLWKGTLDDLAVVEHIDAHYKIIRELNQRGIMNSVCSKNHYDTARAVLEARGIWDELVFPSIDWTSKGPRLVELVAAMQLRPESVLFIDDNNSNLAEAQALAPGIQVGAPSIINGLLEDRRLQGSDDAALTRLAHYKVLFERYKRRTTSNIDNFDFLRDSDIKITIDYDVEANINRAVELINRTNQLNFTKYRLSDDINIAANVLRSTISMHDVKAALINVSDSYGDHGHCGIYVVKGSEVTQALIHFCFSCRIIGMGVEQRVFEFLGYPKLTVVGETASDVRIPSKVDWIKICEAKGDQEDLADSTDFGEVRLRGGCELSSVGHYFNISARSVTYETNYARKHLFFARDCTANLLAPFRCGERVDALCQLDVEPWEYESHLFDPIDSDGILVISMWGDVLTPHYRYRNDNLLMPNSLQNMWENGVNICEGDVEEKFSHGLFNEEYRPETVGYISQLKQKFDFYGRLRAPDLNRNYHDLFQRIPRNVSAFLILPSRYWVSTSGTLIKFPPSIGYNVVVRKVSSEYANVKLVGVDEFVTNVHERHEGFRHFDRVVYYRMYKQISKYHLDMQRETRPLRLL